MVAAKRVYINFSNGIEFYGEVISEYSPMSDIQIVRIQSTACEQKRWGFIIQDLDYQFLMDLAVGFDVIVVDGSQRKKESRAIYQGLEWIKYVLNRYWLSRNYKPIVRGNNCELYFAQVFAMLDRKTLSKLKYVKKFLLTDEIRLHGKCFASTLDGKYDKLTNIYHRCNDPTAPLI